MNHDLNVPSEVIFILAKGRMMKSEEHNKSKIIHSLLQAYFESHKEVLPIKG